MRNIDLQQRLQEMLDELQHLPDDLEVVHYTGLGKVGVMNVYHELHTVDCRVATDGDSLDCVLIAIS